MSKVEVLQPHIIPNLINITSNITNEEFQSTVAPKLIYLMQKSQSDDITLKNLYKFVQNIELIMKRVKIRIQVV